MKINSAADLAAVLDPEHKNAEWWKLDCPECHDGPIACEGRPCKPAWQYIGPDDLHTARKYAWRMEEWLEDQYCGTVRALGVTQVFRASGNPENDVLIEENTDHTAALVAAIERVTG
jgi:hypothetical protein